MFEEDLRAKIADDPAVAEIAARASIAWGDRPQASALPGITLDLIFDARPQHMTGFQELRGTQVQVDCWSLDRLEARNLKEAVIAAVATVATVGDTRFGRSFVDRSTSGWERTDASAIVYRERIDFTVWHAAAS
jgi:hypothetical protein